MRTITSNLVLAIFVSLTVSFSAFAAGNHSVRGHATKKGTYVAPHKQTNPNQTQRDNWSSKGNTNPMTGKNGQKNPSK
jgi:hypothetical protein